MNKIKKDFFLVYNIVSTMIEKENNKLSLIIIKPSPQKKKKKRKEKKKKVREKLKDLLPLIFETRIKKSKDFKKQQKIQK